VSSAARVAATFLVLLLTAACSSHPRPGRVIVVTFDTTRADRFGCYGSDRGLTPNVDALARESTVFDQAVSAVPTTLPSHSTMFTGLYPQDHGVRYNVVFSLNEKAVTLAETLRDAGYRTAAFPATLILARKHGLDQGFEVYEAPERPASAPSGQPPDAVLRPAGEGVDKALAWLGQHESEKTFLWLHFYDPHAPYVPPFPYSSKYRDQPYDGEVAYTDAQFGRFVAELRRSPRWADTLLVVAGDHGEGLHEHGERLHSYLLYETTQHVPLIVHAPGGSGRRVAEPVTLADVTPTVLDYVGLAPARELRGISLRGGAEGRAVPARELYFESTAGALNYGWAELKGIRDGRYKLIDSLAGTELYDLEDDPHELHDLAAEQPERVTALRTALAGLGQKLEGALAAEESHAAIDPRAEAALLALGYVGGGGGGAAKNGPHPRSVIDMEGEMMAARTAIAASDWPAVEDLCHYVLGRDPSNKWALRVMIEALLAQDRADEAEPFAATMIQLYPDRDQGYVLMARAMHARRRLDKAVFWLDQGLAQVPDSEPLTYLRLTADFEAGKGTVCTGGVQEASARIPSSSRLLVLSARCHARDGDAAGALAALERAADRGFNEVALIETAPEFGAVVALPAFADLKRHIEARAKGEKAPSAP